MNLNKATKNTGISPSNQAELETRYSGLAWHQTPENRAFIGARNSCESPAHPTHKYNGAAGIQFLYDSVDDFLADVGFRPSPQYILNRLNPKGHFEPGNVRWALKFDAYKNQNRRPKTDRSLESTMVRIIQRLKREPEMTMVRSQLQHAINQNGARMFHEAMKQLIRVGFAECVTISRKCSEYDDSKPGLQRTVTRTSTVVRLINGNGEIDANGNRNRNTNV